jgi:hypothetical protein
MLRLLYNATFSVIANLKNCSKSSAFECCMHFLQHAMLFSEAVRDGKFISRFQELLFVLFSWHDITLYSSLAPLSSEL